jgi:dTDP-glucose pyrophosphorylase
VLSLNPSLVLLPSATLREALEAITKNGRQAVTVADAAGRLVGLVTDGDVRRAILRGAAIDGPVGAAVNQAPTTAAASMTRDEAIALMRARTIRLLPLVDAERRLVDVLFLDELLRPAPLPNAAVIMAGGAGRRLAPLTETTPKPLLKVGGKPLLEIMIERLRACGFVEIWLVLNYKADMIEKYFREDKPPVGVEIKYGYDGDDDNDKPRGTAGKLGDFRGFTAPFLLVNGDILTKCDFRAMLEFHKRHAAGITIGTVPYTVEVPFGVLETKDERFIGVKEKPRLEFDINAGIYVIEPEVLQQIDRWERLDMPELINRAMNDKLVRWPAHANTLPPREPSKVVAFPIREYWLDVGRLDDFHKADRDVAEGLLE